MREREANARIMIVDDQPANVKLLERMLGKEGLDNLATTTEPLTAPKLFVEFEPDLLVLDLQMPGADGFAVMKLLEPHMADRNGLSVPILVVTADITPEAKRRALEAGAKDFVTKPFDQTEVVLRIRNLLEARFLHQDLIAHNASLEERVGERTRELLASIRRLQSAQRSLRASHEETVQRLSIASELRDDDTGQHIYRMSQLCEGLARGIDMEEDNCRLVRIASQMHDVGKIGIPDAILLKPGKLTSEERSIMERHTEIGFRILTDSTSELLQLAATIALTHHERPDGTGYPNGLMGQAIPIEGRIAAIADVYDALTSDRVYRKAFPVGRALEIMREGRGSQFDPDLLDYFFDSLDPSAPEDTAPASAANH
jgi:response regulator RpfG family c-di-GMP phosphodiesterase